MTKNLLVNKIAWFMNLKSEIVTVHMVDLQFRKQIRIKKVNNKNFRFAAIIYKMEGRFFIKCGPDSIILLTRKHSHKKK